MESLYTDSVSLRFSKNPSSRLCDSFKGILECSGIGNAESKFQGNDKQKSSEMRSNLLLSCVLSISGVVSRALKLLEATVSLGLTIPLKEMLDATPDTSVLTDRCIILPVISRAFSLTARMRKPQPVQRQQSIKAPNTKGLWKTKFGWSNTCSSDGYWMKRGKHCIPKPLMFLAWGPCPDATPLRSGRKKPLNAKLLQQSGHSPGPIYPEFQHSCNIGLPTALVLLCIFKRDCILTINFSSQIASCSVHLTGISLSNIMLGFSKACWFIPISNHRLRSRAAALQATSPTSSNRSRKCSNLEDLQVSPSPLVEGFSSHLDLKPLRFPTIASPNAIPRPVYAPVETN